MSKKAEIDKMLGDDEKLALQMFAENKLQFEAVKKVLLSGIYNNGTLRAEYAPNPTQNFALAFVSRADELNLSDEAIGRQLRAAWEGICMLETGFNNVSLYKRENATEPKKDNPAR